MESKNGNFSQIIITDASATCMMQAFGASNIGRLVLN
jgi:hypothetical protein